MGSIVITKDQHLMAIVIVIGVHQSRFHLAGIYKLPEVQFRSIIELKQAGNKAAQGRTLINLEIG